MAEVGLDVVDNEEVEAEVHKIEEDEEVARIYEDAKDKHRKIMTGGFKSNTVLQLFMSKTSKIQCMQCDALNGTHVKDVEDIKNTCTFFNLQLFVQ